MIYATTPQGKIIEYRTAKTICYDNRKHGIIRLLTRNNGDMIADIPTTWAVSFKRPSEGEGSPDITITTALMLLSSHIRDCNSWRHSTYLSELKKKLSKWDSRSGCWK